MKGYLTAEKFAELLGVRIARAKQLLAIEAASDNPAAEKVGRAWIIREDRANEIAQQRRKPTHGPERSGGGGGGG